MMNNAEQNTISQDFFVKPMPKPQAMENPFSPQLYDHERGEARSEEPSAKKDLEAATPTEALDNDGRAGKKAEVLSEIVKMMVAYDLYAEDIFGPRAVNKALNRDSAATTRPAKYRNKSGEEWSGLGRQPMWMKLALRDGAQKEDFLIV